MLHRISFWKADFEVNRTKRRDSKHKKRRAHILLFAAVSLSILLIISLVMLTIILVNYGQDQKLYREARALAVKTNEPVQTAAPASSSPVASILPAPTETPPILIDFEAVRKKGPNVLAWLYSTDTLINYPVVIYGDNSHYLTHDYTGSHSSSGALFFDCRLSKQLTDQNLIIYGHHMKNRSMFGNLLQYQKQSYYDEHPTMYLLTPEKNYRIDLFAAQFTDSDEKFFPIWFESEQKRQAFVQAAIANSTFTPDDASYRTDGQIISLVTCAYSDYIEDAKFQVNGWLTEIG
ncbi:MAG TPA: class B sortase [Negativicutes bacterium]|nr:class B sortase [Negativicutes bacterium]